MRFGTKLTPIIPPMTPGTKMGICIGFLGIGEQLRTYKGKSGYIDQVMLVIEFPSEKIEIDGELKPRELSKIMTRTDGDNGCFNKTMSSWFAAKLTKEELLNIDDNKLLGRPCMVTVSLSEDGKYANIDNISQFPDGFPIPTTDTIPYSFDVYEWDDKVFEALPERIQNRIKKSLQYQKDHAPTDEIKVNTSTGEVCPI